MQFLMFAQVKIDGIWHSVDSVFKSALKEAGDTLTNRPYDGRNYVLFEILTGKHFEQNDYLTKLFPICDDIKDKTVEYGSYPNDYVFQYATLRDLLTYNWDETVSDIGYITEYQYKKMKNDGVQPAAIRKNVALNDSKVVSPFEIAWMEKNPDLRGNNKYYVKFENNTRKLIQECRFFCEETIPALIKLVPSGGNFDDVRIIYGMTT